MTRRTKRRALAIGLLGARSHRARDLRLRRRPRWPTLSSMARKRKKRALAATSLCGSSNREEPHRSLVSRKSAAERRKPHG
jgi:hypothetical protein